MAHMQMFFLGVLLLGGCGTAADLMPSSLFVQTRPERGLSSQGAAVLNRRCPGQPVFAGQNSAVAVLRCSFGSIIPAEPGKFRR